MIYQGIYYSVVFSQLLLVHSQLLAVERGMITTAVAAPVSYSASFEKEYPTRTEILYWNLGTKRLARIDVYNDNTYTISNSTSDSRIFPSVQQNLLVYNFYLVISDVNLNDSGSVELLRSSPSPAFTLTFLPLNVKECDNTSDGIDTGINVSKLGSYSHKDEVDVSCSTGYTDNDVQVTLECLANATWSKTGSCVLVTTTPTTTTIDTTTSGANSTYGEESGGFPQGHTAAIVIGVIFLVLLIIHLSLGVFVGLDVVKTLLSTLIIGGLYVLGSVLSIIGIFMCSFGNPESTADYMNGVEKAGTALGTIGLVIIIAALIKAAVTGGSKDYSAGSQ